MNHEEYTKFKERNRYDGPHCSGCGLSYGSLAWADVIVPNFVWNRISGSPWKGSGLLCFNCIVERCAILGLSDVPFAVKSGPLRIMDDEVNDE